VEDGANFCGFLRISDLHFVGQYSDISSTTIASLHCGLCGACEGLGFGLRSASQANYISYLA
jgi:hypothetical protein